MALSIIQHPDQVAPFIQRVQTFADQKKSEFGFFPASVYEEAASAGKLWIATIKDKQLAGYLLFGGAYPHLRVTQVGVLDEFKGNGIGKALIANLIKFASDHSYLGVIARVAAELPANGFWEHMRFRVIDQKPGRGANPRLINIRLFEIPDAGLFSPASEITQRENQAPETRLPILSLRAFVIDLNVLFDVTHSRFDHSTSGRFINAAFEQTLRLSVTPEFAAELDRNAQTTSDPYIKLVKQFPTLPTVSEETLSSLIAELRPLIFPTHPSGTRREPQRISDLRHLAYCIVHRVTGFITRDKAIIGATETLNRRYGIEVLAPADVIYEDAPESLPMDATISFGDKGHARLAQVAPSQIDKIEKAIQGAGIPTDSLSFWLNPGTLSRPVERYAVWEGDNLIGYCRIGHPSGSRIEAALYVNEGVYGFERAFDALLSTLHRHGGALTCFVVEIPVQNLATSGQLSRLGYRKCSTATTQHSTIWIRISKRGPITPNTWPDLMNAFKSHLGYTLPDKMPSYPELQNTGIPLRSSLSNNLRVIPYFEFETWIGPGMLLARGRQGVIVPIRQQYANWLLDLDTKQSELLPSPEARMHLERAFFLTVRARQYFSRGLPILFYVSGAEGGEKAIVGVGRVTLATRMTLEEARSSLVRQGIPYYLDNLRTSDDSSQTVVTFDNVTLFPHPVTYERLKELDCISGANLITAQPLTFEKLCTILSEGFQET